MRQLTFLILVLIVFSTIVIAENPEGEAIFHKTCINCHGPDLSGHTAFGMKAKIPDLRSPAVQNKSDQELFDSIGRGVGHKEYPHAFLSRGYTKQQVESLIAYIRSMKK